MTDLVPVQRESGDHLARLVTAYLHTLTSPHTAPLVADN